MAVSAHSSWRLGLRRRDELADVLSSASRRRSDEWTIVRVLIRFLQNRCQRPVFFEPSFLGGVEPRNVRPGIDGRNTQPGDPESAGIFGTDDAERVELRRRRFPGRPPARFRLLLRWRIAFGDAPRKRLSNGSEVAACAFDMSVRSYGQRAIDVYAPVHNERRLSGILNKRFRLGLRTRKPYSFVRRPDVRGQCASGAGYRPRDAAEPLAVDAYGRRIVPELESARHL